MEPLGFSIDEIMSSVNRDTFTYSFLICFSFYLFFLPNLSNPLSN